MRRCPHCFSVYRDRTDRCRPCDAPTEPYSEEPAVAPRRAPAPQAIVDAPAGGEATDEVLLAEADAEWAERAVDALGLAGITARMLLSEDEPPVVAVVVAAQDLERAIDVIGEALDEPPAVPRPAGAASMEEGPAAEPEPDPEEDLPTGTTPSVPSRPLDPDQAAVCPECGEAYRAGFERCADCGVPLVPADGPRGG